METKEDIERKFEELKITDKIVNYCMCVCRLGDFDELTTMKLAVILLVQESAHFQRKALTALERMPPPMQVTCRQCGNTLILKANNETLQG